MRIRNTTLVVAGMASALLAQTPAPHPFFDTPGVHDIYLEFPQANYWQQLLANYNENSDDIPYIEAKFQWNDVVYEKVGVRFKGNSSFRGSTTKKPFRIKLNEFTKGQKIGGTASFNLNNLWNDPSFVREKLYFDLAARAGLRAPRSNFANLYINGEYWGLYGLGEVINGDFLDSRYPTGERSGNLYKAESPGASLEYRGDDKAAYGTLYSKKSNEDDPSWEDLIALMKAIRDTPGVNASAELGKILDIRSVLTAFALDNLTVNLDSYVGMAQNYYIYRRPGDGKFEWLVWDPSLAFGALSFGVPQNQIRTLPLEWTATAGGPGGPGGGPGGFGGARPLATLLWSVPEIREEYRVIYRRLVEDVVRPEEVLANARLLREIIRPFVELDKNKLATLDAFDRALTEDVAPGVNQGGGGPGGPPPGGVPPGGPGPGGPPPGGPGAGGPGGFGLIPGIEGLVRARDTFVREQLTPGR